MVNELTYDSFNENAERIYRIVVKGQMAGNELNQAITAAPMAEAMINDCPEVENVTRLAKFGGWLVIYGEKKFNETEKTFLFADSTFFDVFSLYFFSYCCFNIGPCLYQFHEPGYGTVCQPVA